MPSAVAIVALLLAPTGAMALDRSAGPPTVGVVAEGLRIPWDIAFLPDGRALVTERGGTVRLVDADRRLLPGAVATVPVSERGDGGLLGVAVDPAFGPGAPFVYLSHTTDGALRVTRWRVDGDRLVRDAEVLEANRTGGVHNSGRVRFGPDGAMYVGTGDGGDPSAAQSLTRLEGKILRVAPGAYRGSDATPEIVARGLRHPQGLAWQPGSGRFFVTDHGPSGFDGVSGDDELDEIVPGGNYGWPDVRGADHTGFIAPTHLWSVTIAPASIAFLALPGSEWTGSALVTGLKGVALHRLSFDGGRVTGDETLFPGTYGRLRAVAEAPDGSVWVSTSNRDPLGTATPGDDRILRIVPPAADVPPAGAAPGSVTPASDVRVDPPPPAGPAASAPASAVPGRVVLVRRSAPRSTPLGRPVTIRLVFTTAPGAPVVLQRSDGRRWVNVTAVRRPGRSVGLVFRPSAAGVTRLRVRYRTGTRFAFASFVIRVAGPRTEPRPTGE